MKSIKGILFIVASMLVTILGWLSSGSPQFLIPGLALTTLSLTFILATRLPLLEEWFNGLENMYSAHKFTAFLSILLLLFHNFSMGGLWGSRLAAQLGNIHRVVYLAYIFGLLHVYMMMSQRLFSLSLLSFLVGIYAILGLIAGFYIIFLYQQISFTHLGKIIGIKHLNHDTTELEIKLSKPFQYKYGQFAFLKIFQEGFEQAPHPFSISGGSGKTLYFTIKNSGDHTKNIFENLKVGSKVTVDRAYGHMLLEQGQDQQIWIAGGIGITPFISYIRENPVLTKSVRFYYSYRGKENAVYLNLLHAYAEKNPNFDLRLIDSTQDGYLNFENEDIPDQTSIYMCGPLVMMEAISKSIKEKHPKAELIYEGFKFK